jgi:peptide/nickel transport system substrate-binding protein
LNRKARRDYEALRRGVGPMENQLFDDFAAAELDRREFLRRATVLGLSVSAAGAALGALGHAPAAWARPAAARVGGRLRLGVTPAPGGAIEPIQFGDSGSLSTGAVCGEFLTRATSSLRLKPELAVSWAANKDASVWTFKLRPGVMFQDGQTMKADDVVATYKRLTGPGSQALSAFQGVLKPAGIRKVDDLTVAFHLESPTASFPYLTSSTTYQAIVLPASYQPGTFTSTPQTTGAFKMVSYQPGVGATYDRFDRWWGGHAPLDGVDLTYFPAPAAADAALLSGSIDLFNEISVGSDRSLFNNKAIQIFSAQSAAHREVPMRTDQPPFNDYRVRQAVALTLDRPAILKRLLKGYGSLGNDSPFAPVFPSTAPVAQRHKDIAKAKQLMAAAGKSQGFDVTMTVQNDIEMPLYAQIIQESVREIGIKMKLRIENDSVYFAGSSKTTPWLNTPINVTGWGARAVPNVYLTADLGTGGVWNAPHYSSKQFDALAKSYLGAIALKDQRKYSAKIERLLLHDTPLIIGYFTGNLAAGSKKVKGFYVGANGEPYVSHVSLAA